jgi:acyl carrier protein
MEKEQIFSWIVKTLGESFDVPPERVQLQSRLNEDLDIDSIDAVDLMVKLRQITEQRISPDAFRSVRTVGDVVNAIHALVQKG